MAEINNLGELLPISENNGQKAVNARYLHSFLESKQQFADWIKGRINKYDFVEGKDFETLYFDYQGNLLNIRHHNFMKSENQQVSKIEYALSISMAKELSMLENNERGKQARKYFIACEENKRELSRKELLLMALQAEEDKERLALENEKKQKQIERLKPKADFAEPAFKKILFSFGNLLNCCTFAVRQLYLHNSYVDFLYPYGILFNNIMEKLHSCLYLPHSSKEVVADLECTSPFFINK